MIMFENEKNFARGPFYNWKQGQNYLTDFQVECVISEIVILSLIDAIF